MTPEARLATAAELLDLYLAGEPAERVLTNWSRRSRFAGSKDRAAVRDHVFDAIRRRRSAAAMGGGETGRGLVIGLLRLQGQDPSQFLTGEGYALPALTQAEAEYVAAPDAREILDCPEWLSGELLQSLGEEFLPVFKRLQSRADVFLRVNPKRGTLASAQEMLADEGILTEMHALSETCLLVRDGARRVHTSQAYRDGLVELQDAASQAVSDRIPLPASGPVLDYCAGGGGKALALAARSGLSILAHDAAPRRMKDIPTRAERAGCDIRTVDAAAVMQNAPYRLVVADVPCSGSGAWRRQPEARWSLDRETLDRLLATQAEILSDVADLVAPGGCLAYLTCSLLRCENEDQADQFLDRHPDWGSEARHRVSPLQGGDGFFLEVLRRKAEF